MKADFGQLWCYNERGTNNTAEKNISQPELKEKTSPVHTTPAALFVRSGLPPTLVRLENEAFRRRSSNWRNLKTPALRFSVDGEQFEYGAFRKR